MKYVKDVEKEVQEQTITELTEQDIEELSKEIEDELDMLIEIEEPNKTKVLHTADNEQREIKGEVWEYESIEEVAEVSEEAWESLKNLHDKELNDIIEGKVKKITYCSGCSKQLTDKDLYTEVSLPFDFKPGTNEIVYKTHKCCRSCTRKWIMLKEYFK